MRARTLRFGAAFAIVRERAFRQLVIVKENANAGAHLSIPFGCHADERTHTRIHTRKTYNIEHKHTTGALQTGYNICSCTNIFPFRMACSSTE